MTLVRKAGYIIDGTNIAIIFNTERHFINSIGTFYVRFKAWSMIIAVGSYRNAKSGIEGDVKVAPRFIDDRPDLDAPGIY